MELKKLIFPFVILLIIGNMGVVYAQLSPGVYISDVNNVHHELKIKDGYLIHSIYEASPAKFIKTLGGFYTAKDGVLNIKLEFNSDYENDNLTQMTIPFVVEKGKLTLKTEPELVFIQAESLEQDLDGAWLFATRGPENGQERRGNENTRKTLKFLLDGRFQWIAYDTAGLQFKGTGGGSYTATEGVYTENIEYFSRDNDRVGATLEFNYELKGTDWHHTGKNSKGEPMYEIWGKRE